MIFYIKQIEMYGGIHARHKFTFPNLYLTNPKWFYNTTPNLTYTALMYVP